MNASATSAPHTVAVGNIQLVATEYWLNEANGVETVKGFALHLVCSGTETAQRIVETAGRKWGCYLFLLAGQECQYLVISPNATALAGMVRELSHQYVNKPTRKKGRGAQLSPGRECVLLRTEYRTTGASVRPSTGSGGEQGKRYHALYNRQEATGVEPELAGGEKALEGQEATTSNRHAGITGRSYEGLRKRGYGN